MRIKLTILISLIILSLPSFAGSNSKGPDLALMQQSITNNNVIGRLGINLNSFSIIKDIKHGWMCSLELTQDNENYTTEAMITDNNIVFFNVGSIAKSLRIADKIQ